MRPARWTPNAGPARPQRTPANRRGMRPARTPAHPARPHPSAGADCKEAPAAGRLVAWRLERMPAAMETHQRVRELRSEGLTLEEIGRRVGLLPRQVQEVLDEPRRL